MVQMRWFKWYMEDDDGYSHERGKLQYRQKIDGTIRSGLYKQDGALWSDRLEWSDWIDVPTQWKDEFEKEEQ